MLYNSTMPKKRTKQYNVLFLKEIGYAILALLSVLSVFYEMLWALDPTTISSINTFDIVVALVFLTDFMYYLLQSKNKSLYLRKNWYLLLASIPILETWAELLRGLRLLELVRLVRAGEHLSVSINNANGKNHKHH